MSNQGLVTAYLLNGKGGGAPLEWEQINAWQPEQGLLWVHLDYQHEYSHVWLREQSGLDELAVEAMLAESTRPRCSQLQNGTLLFLRGVNLNPGSDPEDMVSIRLWIEESRIISVRLWRLLSIDDLRNAIEQQRGPINAGDFVVQLAERLSSRMAGVIDDIDDKVDQLQDQVLDAQDASMRKSLTDLRREIIAMRRYLAPQRDALVRLTHQKISWLNEVDVLYLREESDRVTRYVEDLDSARERAAVTQEELSNRLSEQLNARMYVLSVVAAIFLPLGFLTGLFGINVGGIPLANSPYGFLDIVLLLAGISIVQILIFRWKKWF